MRFLWQPATADRPTHQYLMSESFLCCDLQRARAGLNGFQVLHRDRLLRLFFNIELRNSRCAAVEGGRDQMADGDGAYAEAD